MDVPAAATNPAALMAGAGVTRALLAIHLFRRTRDHATGLGLVRPLAKVGLVHHDRVVQKLLVDARSEIGGLDVVRPHFLSFAIVNGELGHGVIRVLKLVAEAASPSCDELLLLFLLVLLLTLWFHGVGFADDDVAAVRARDRAADKQQIVF